MAETGLNERDEVEALLPFLANNTLDGEDRVRVEAAVAADADLAVQLRALRRIRREVKAEEMDWSPGEMGLAKLLREIEIESPSEAPVEAVVDAPVQQAPPRLTLTDAINGPTSSTVSRTTVVQQAANTNTRLRIWQIAAAGGGSQPLPPSPSLYGPAVAVARMSNLPAVTPVHRFGESRLRIAFQGTATESDIRALLLAQNLIIVDGPSALGLYTVAVDDASVDDAIAALLANRTLIENVSVGQLIGRLRFLALLAVLVMPQLAEAQLSTTLPPNNNTTTTNNTRCIRPGGTVTFTGNFTPSQQGEIVIGTQPRPRALTILSWRANRVRARVPTQGVNPGDQYLVQWINNQQVQGTMGLCQYLPHQCRTRRPQWANGHTYRSA